MNSEHVTKMYKPVEIFIPAVIAFRIGDVNYCYNNIIFISTKTKMALVKVVD